MYTFFFVCLLSTSFVDFDSLGDIFNLQINVFVAKIMTYLLYSKSTPCNVKCRYFLPEVFKLL
jgi:hypothetical protein